MSTLEPIPNSRTSKKVQLNPTSARANQALLHALCTEHPTIAANGFEKLVNYSALSHEPIHRWFRYREGFSLQLVKKLITGLPKGSIVVDPFCGCGTTLLAAQQLGYESYGLDINPISTLVSRVKTNSYDYAHVEMIHSHFARMMRLTRASPCADPPALKILDKVFNPDVLHALLVLRRYLDAVDDVMIAEFLKVGWLSILEGVSNVFKEGNGIKYRNRKRTPRGYITIPDEQWQAARQFPSDKFRFVFDRFKQRIDQMLSDLEDPASRRPSSYVIEADAATLSQHIDCNTAAYVVFSPPYCNCFNYFKIFKIELWMGGFVKSYRDIQILNRRAMRSHVETILERDGDSPNELVDKFVELIDPSNLWDRRIPKAIRGYFIDMSHTLNEIFKILRPSGKCAIVVGNSAYGGIVVPTDALLAHLGNERGFSVERIAVARHLTTSSQQRRVLDSVRPYLRESIVFLEKPDPRLDEKRQEIVDEFPHDVEPTTDTVFVIRNSGLTAVTHKFHRFPGKFIPHVPRWAISKYLQGQNAQIVFDPFCGSGTTNLEALRLGHHSFGIDVDFISRLLTKVKTTPLTESYLEKHVTRVLSSIGRRTRARFRPSIDTLDHWFSPEAIKELGIIRDVIDSYRKERDLHDFLLVCFLAIIRRSSNADNQTLKTYVSHTHPKQSESARALFVEVLPDYAQRLSQLTRELGPASPKVCEILPYWDARDFATAWKLDGYPLANLVVTSPPYVKTVDYVYNQMAEYFWIGDLFDMETQKKQNERKKRYIGTEKVRATEYRTFLETGIAEIDELSARVYEKDPKHSFIVSSYFNDMRQHFLEAKQVLAGGAHYVLVVGDSLVNNEIVPVHQLIQHCAKSAGYSTVGLFGYEIRNRHMRFPRRGRGGMIRYEWVLDFTLDTVNGR